MNQCFWRDGVMFWRLLKLILKLLHHRHAAALQQQHLSLGAGQTAICTHLSKQLDFLQT